jgi:hypothetical protein
MPSTRQHMRKEPQGTTRRIADDISRTARTLADVTERAVHASADMVRLNANAVQQAWQSGNELATRSTEQFGRALGITGEDAQNARQQSLQNFEVVVQSNTALAQAMQKISLESFEFARKRMVHNLEWFDTLLRCRTLQEFAAVQSDFARDNLEDLLQTSRRMAEFAIRTTDEEVRDVFDNVELAPGDIQADRPSARKHTQHAATRQATARRTTRPARTVR